MFFAKQAREDSIKGRLLWPSFADNISISDHRVTTPVAVQV